MKMSIDIEFEVMLSYWLSWYTLPSDPQDLLNPYVFPLTIWLVEREWLVLVLIYLDHSSLDWTNALETS